MHANVPQFIDIEDKIGFGLTGKQILWLAGGAAMLFVAYSLFDRQLFYFVGFFIALIFGGLAFVRPQGVSLIYFLGFTLMYFIKPKSYVWKREYQKENLDMKKASLAQMKNSQAAPVKKHLPNRGQLKRIAWELDTKK